MEIKVSKLKDVMDLVKPAVPKKPTVKVAAYLSLGNGKAVATDLETMIVVNLPEANDPMLIPYSSVAEMLKYVPGNETLKMEQKGKIISLVWQEGSATYPTENFADFPILPEMEARGEGFIDGDTLIAAMTAALPYVADDEKRSNLNGVTLVLGNPVEVAAGDGFRMTHQTLALSFPLEEKIIIPAHSVAILEHVFKKTPRTPPTAADTIVKFIIAKRQLRVSLVGENKLKVDFGTTATVYVNLTDAKPPEWLALIPKGDPILQSQIFVPQLEAAAKRVRDIAKEGSGIVRMEFADGHVKLSAKKDDQEITTIVDTLFTQGEPGRTALNQKYLLEYLSGKQGIITFSKYTDNGPTVFEYQQSPRVLIMPMYVQWDDEKPLTEAETTAPETSDIKEDVDTEEEEKEGDGDEFKSEADEAAEQETNEETPVTTD